MILCILHRITVIIPVLYIATSQMEILPKDDQHANRMLCPVIPQVLRAHMTSTVIFLPFPDTTSKTAKP